MQPEGLIFDCDGTIVDTMPIHYAAWRATTARHKYMELIGNAKEIPEVMQIVRESHGKLPMAIASGGTHETVEGILQHCGIRHYFDAIVTSQDVENPKPAPDTFFEAARRINVAPEKCRAYEDADMGIKAILAAGMEAVDVRDMLAAASK